MLHKPELESHFAGALVLVNSASQRYLDFRHLIQPYLDHFGIPYVTHDLAAESMLHDVGRYALVIVGHDQLDPTGVLFGESDQQALVAAVRTAGSGLVVFDGTLADPSGQPLYHYAQDLLGFTSYAPDAVTAASIEIHRGLHSEPVTSRHSDGEVLKLLDSLCFAQIGASADTEVLATAGGHPLLTSRRCGAGRVLHWANYGWAHGLVRGPVFGLDDLVWRGMVWAARKPFVLRGMPPFLTMRVDDTSGWGQNEGPTPLWWMESLRQHGFKPWMGLFISEISQQGVEELKGYLARGDATASVHGFTWHNFFYYDHWNRGPFSDAIVAEHFRMADAWYERHGNFPMSKLVLGHFYELGSNTLAGLARWGTEFVGTFINVDDHHTDKPYCQTRWMSSGPYRKYEDRRVDNAKLWPIYYADFLRTPGAPEYDGHFFNVLTEIRDVADYEWCPDNDVPGTIERGVAELRRCFDSLVLATLFTHESDYISLIRPENWEPAIAGIVAGVADYDPIFVTMDEACGYVRALHTSRVAGASWDATTGNLEILCTGHTDRPTRIGVFLDDSLRQTWVDVPSFQDAVVVPFSL